MTPERWQKIEEIFQSTLDRPMQEREPFLNKACDGDETLRHEVESLLASDRQPDSKLDDIASGVAAQWVAENDDSGRIGQTVGRYRIIGMLGSGGMGNVYLAEDTTLDRKVALKFLPRQFTQDQDRLRRFEQEARAASALNHPNIITIYEVGEWNGGHFIVTEYIEGETLRDRLQKGALPVNELLEIGTQAAGALSAAHSAGIIHRDIKPANIMVRADGYIKVLDFGIAKLSTATARPEVTDPGRVMGTVNYMSPEQALGQPVDVRTDIFSLGVVLYEMATGHRPFEGDSDAAIYDGILHKTQLPLRDFDQKIPSELDRVIGRALEKDPEHRCQHAADLRTDLKLLAQGSSPSYGGRFGHFRSRARKWLGWQTVGAAAAILIALIAILWRLWPNQPAEISQKSIAVLPFENLSSDKENAYFTDGIQVEILTRLSKIADLKVISHSSTQHYKSAPENLPEIARQLGVAHIIEGNVQKSGDTVRINVQLIKAANDSHLWADTFDRKLTDIFSVESDVAKAIADQLRAKLTGQEERVIAAKPTDNTEAYDAYLRGLAYSLKTFNTPANALSAQKYLKEAVRLDSKFALSWALLSYIDARGYISTALPPTAALREEARQAVETALTLQPNLGEAVWAKGFYHYACLKDYDTAVRYFEQARPLLPNSSRIPESLAYLTRRRGQWDRSESYFNEAERLDPRNVRLLNEHAGSYIMLRRSPEAIRKLDQILNITPDDEGTLTVKATVAQAQGDLPRAAAILAPLRPNADNFNSLQTQVYQEILERRPAQFTARLKEILTKPDPALGYINGVLRFWLGWSQDVAGDHAAAQESWRQARSELESFLKEQPDNYFLIGYLALTNMSLGDKAAAFKLIEQAMAAVPIEKDAIFGPTPIEILARVTAQMGEPDRAIAALQKLLSIPYTGPFSDMPLTPALLRLDPMFDPLRNDPRFQKLASSAPSK
jgi:non-specific serine/threonine protein kinase